MIIIKNTHQDRFAITPKELLESNQLSWKAKGMLSWITSHSEGYRLHVSTIIKYSKEGRDSVYGGIKELEDAGYLAKHQPRLANGCLGGVHYLASQHKQTLENWLKMIEEVDWAEIEGSTTYSPMNTPACGKPVYGVQTTASGFSASGKPDTKNNNTKNNNKNIIKIKADSRESSDADFKRFWEAGLPKAKKIRAKKAFKQLRDKKSDPTAFTNMLIADIQRRNQDHQFGFDQLHPTTYLNDQRWTDEHTPRPLKLVETSFIEKHTNTDWRDEILNCDEKAALQSEFKAMPAV